MTISNNIKRLNRIIKESTTPKRAGIIPVYVDIETNNVYAYTMIPSDPAYGGSSPQMAKGKTSGMSVEDTAWKEAHEELGLVKSNTVGGLKRLAVYPYSGMKDSDEIAIYYVYIKDTEKWDKPHYETGWSGWINLSTDMGKIRKNQQQFFKDILKKVDPQYKLQETVNRIEPDDLMGDDDKKEGVIKK